MLADAQAAAGRPLELMLSPWSPPAFMKTNGQRTGGGALNVGIRKAFEEELMKDVYVASYPQFNGAIGAALIASERA